MHPEPNLLIPEDHGPNARAFPFGSRIAKAQPHIDGRIVRRNGQKELHGQGRTPRNARARG